MTSEHTRRSERIGRKIFANVSRLLETIELTVDEIDEKHELGHGSTKRDGIAWSGLYYSRLRSKPGFADEVGSTDALYRRYANLHPEGWLICDTADALGVSADQILPTATLDAAGYREARLAIEPQALDGDLRISFWRLVCLVANTFRRAALQNPELAIGFSRKVEDLAREVEVVERHRRAVVLSLRRR